MLLSILVSYTGDDWLSCSWTLCKDFPVKTISGILKDYMDGNIRIVPGTYSRNDNGGDAFKSTAQTVADKASTLPVTSNNLR